MPESENIKNMNIIKNKLTFVRIKDRNFFY